jgi:uncharacterized membrane-anchored protein YitT (DUF2179 family)
MKFIPYCVNFRDNIYIYLFGGNLGMTIFTYKEVSKEATLVTSHIINAVSIKSWVSDRGAQILGASSPWLPTKSMCHT